MRMKEVNTKYWSEIDIKMDHGNRLRGLRYGVKGGLKT